MQPRRVAVTGLGLMTGAGLDLESSWKAVVAGKSPARRFTLFDPEGLSPSFGVELPDGAEEVFRSRIKTRHRTLMTRGTEIAVVTAGMALADARLDRQRVPSARVGVVVGTTGTGYVGPGGTDGHRILRNMSNSPASWVSLLEKIEGPSFAVSTACSSGAYALGAAFLLIESGICDVVVAGAADSSLNRLDVQGFSDILALAEQADGFETASRPFDRRRSGFVMAEGGGFLVLESAAHARGREARIYAEMPLPALTSEAYNIMSPEPTGAGMAAAMARALEQAGIEAREVDYVNAHGTSTLLNDRCEVRAIKTVFGQAAASLPISSTKGVTGHCLAGAAGVEAVLSCKAIAERTIPPTANLTEPDPELGLDFVPLEARRKELRSVMCNSFAFGGHNGVTIFVRPER